MLESTLLSSDDVRAITGEVSLLIATDHDILNARQKTRWFAERIGFRGSWHTILSTIISGLAGNALTSAMIGKVTHRSVRVDGKKRLLMVVTESAGGIGGTVDRYRMYQAQPHPNDPTAADYHYAKSVADRFELGCDREGTKALKVLKWLSNWKAGKGGTEYTVANYFTREGNLVELS